MGASLQAPALTTPVPKLWDILALDALHRNQLIPEVPAEAPYAQVHSDGVGVVLAQATAGADIDISGPEFNFVRSIRVYNVTYASQRESGRDGDCNRSFSMRIGSYGTQGGFRWARGSSPSQLPQAHVGLERYGEHCPGIFHRSVFVDWRDYEGNYGFEQVNY